MKKFRIDRFTGPHAFLSNFTPARVEFEGKTWSSVEHAYQAAKSDDPVYRSAVAACFTAKKAKRLGKIAKLRADWNETKIPIMRTLLEQKFAPGTENARLLLGTNDAELVEGNWWGDTFWGECGGVGENHLGQLLMEIREKLRA